MSVCPVRSTALQNLHVVGSRSIIYTTNTSRHMCQTVNIHEAPPTIIYPLTIRAVLMIHGGDCEDASCTASNTAPATLSQDLGGSILLKHVGKTWCEDCKNKLPVNLDRWTSFLSRYCHQQTFFQCELRYRSCCCLYTASERNANWRLKVQDLQSHYWLTTQ